MPNTIRASSAVSRFQALNAFVMPSTITTAGPDKRRRHSPKWVGYGVMPRFPENHKGDQKMRWLAILNGKHWGDISPVIFHKHHRNKDWRMTLCDAVDTGGAMIEITRGDIRCYVPQDAVVAAVHIQYPNETVGFIDPKIIEEGAHD
ncbi:hypothetical protein HHL24_33220 [Paraburkholderia sp. RP-4-7]|jgi:hypothetical protein|uniref:Uncharacterized protein n=1 Tax=Paraburkholderia polaris TaxID=2728848 RepID=A0A848IRE8_9BURK|nr:hypothetical protein [Paraburkholderia polaris]NMM02769.1 hypothetical protein [Paraburkholderia polaris]